MIEQEKEDFAEELISKETKPILFEMIQNRLRIFHIQIEEFQAVIDVMGRSSLKSFKEFRSELNTLAKKVERLEKVQSIQKEVKK